MRSMQSNLLLDEQIKYQSGLHWKVYSRPILASLFVFGPAMLLALAVNAQVIAFFPAALMLGIFLVTKLNCRHAVFMVTNKRIIVRVGLLRTRSSDLLLLNVESIVTQRGLLGKLFDYGDLVITGSGGTQEHLYSVRSPSAFSNAVAQQQFAAAQQRFSI